MNDAMIKERLLGGIWVGLSAVGFGAGPIFARLAYAEGVDTATLMFLRFSIAGGILAALMFYRRESWPQRADLVRLLLLGGIVYVGQSFCYFTALRFASAGLTALLLYLYPALVTVIVSILTRRMLCRARIWALAAALVGTALTVSDGLEGNLLGIMLGLGAALIYSAYVVIGERVLRKVGILASATVIMLAAAAVYGVALIGQGPAWPVSTAGWSGAGGVALFSTVGGIIGLFAGIRHLGAVDASTLSTMEPVVTIVLAAMFLGESIHLRQLLGGAVILGAVIFLIRYRVSGYGNQPGS